MAAPIRLGMLTPSSNTCLEPTTIALLGELDSLVSVHFSRFAVTEISLGANALAQFDYEPMLSAARLLRDAEVSALAWGGTSGSWLGIDRDRELCRLLEDAGGVPATTSTLALLDALRCYGVRRYGLAVPYTSDVTDRIIATLAGEGFECAARSDLGISRNFDFDQVDPGRIEALIHAAAEGADAVVVACTNLRAGPLVANAEVCLGVPVFDSVIATVWRLLELTGEPASLHGWGELALNGTIRLRLDGLLTRLLEETGAGRTTIRLDVRARGLHVDRVGGEAVAAGVRSIRHDGSLDQSAMPTVQWIRREQRTLIQNDFAGGDPPVPPALIETYGVRAQMLEPLVRDGQMFGWISVHEIGRERGWDQAAIGALQRAGEEAGRIIAEAVAADQVAGVA